MLGSCRGCDETGVGAEAYEAFTTIAQASRKNLFEPVSVNRFEELKKGFSGRSCHHVGGVGKLLGRRGGSFKWMSRDWPRESY